MRKVLMTMGLGEHYAAYLALTRPLFMDYAERHGYDYHEVGAQRTSVTGAQRQREVFTVEESRPLSWSKVPALSAALEQYDEVLWMDCDAVILDGREDIAAHVPPDAWQALSVVRRHQGLEMGEVPGCGLWFVRRPMRPVLHQLWGMAQYINHPWWETAAMHELLGYTYNGVGLFPVRRTRETDLFQHTYLLPDSWQSVDYHNPDAWARTIHVVSAEPPCRRLALIRDWAQRAASYAGVAYGD